MVVRIKKGNGQLPSSLLPCCDRTRPVRMIISVPFATLPTWRVHPGSRRGSPLLGANAMLPPRPHARRHVPLHPVNGGGVLLTRTTPNPLLCFLFSGADAVSQSLSFTVSLCWGDFSLPKCEKSFILPGHIRSGFSARSGLSLSLTGCAWYKVLVKTESTMDREEQHRLSSQFTKHLPICLFIHFSQSGWFYGSFLTCLWWLKVNGI